MENQELLKQMGERIYKKRRDLKLTQEKFAEIIGVSTQMISNLELGKKAIRPQNLLKVCEALNVSADYVLSGKIPGDDTYMLCDELSNLGKDELKVIKTILEYMKITK